MPTAFLLMLAVAAADPQSGTLEVFVDGLRNSNGLLQACLMQDARKFPDCGKDPGALRSTVKASNGHLLFSGIAPGEYALTLFHDENANRKLDTVLGIPKEGFGFSRNPVVRFGAPRYDKVNIRLGPGLTRMRVRMQYLL